MTVKGFTTVGSGSLACGSTDADWHFSIRRVDERTHGAFYELHDKEVLPSHVAEYVPNWQQLAWTQIKDHMFSTSESYATDTEFKVNVMSKAEGTKSHGEVVEAFLAFMGGT